MTKKIIFVCLVCITLITGCMHSGNQQIHGVSPATWEQLTLEQRQLIIDSALRDTLNSKITTNVG